MASTFKFHTQVDEIVPWQATYAFPSQATKVNKQIVKIPAKNGYDFNPGQVMRIEFPADNYLNMLNSYLQLDLSFTTNGATDLKFQRGGVQNLVKRLRIMYGSLVLEDIQEYKTLVRMFSECGVSQAFRRSSGGILEGSEASRIIEQDATATGAAGSETATVTAQSSNENGESLIGPGGTTRTYCMNLFSGMMTSKKLIPLKWMAAQLAIEITLATPADAMLYATTNLPTYKISNPNFVAEMMEFDSTYDQAFFAGLKTSGVALKMSTWHYHSFNLQGQTNVLQIHERARSVKAGYAIIRSGESNSGFIDSDRMFYAAGEGYNLTNGFITSQSSGGVQQFQWRVGGRYYPAQPVRCTNGGAEAYVELQKAINTFGDYTVDNSIDFFNWTTYPSGGNGSKFIMAAEFENTDVMPGTIAGINAEEQSDIALTFNINAAPNNKKCDVFMHYDLLLVVRDGNTVDLIM